MSLQEYFNKAAEVLIAQGRKSANKNTCLYRGPNGTRCAVGVFLDDETAAIFDAQPLTGIEGIPVDLVPDFIRDNMEFFIALQEAHDGANDEDFVTSFTERMNLLAGSFGLARLK